MRAQLWAADVIGYSGRWPEPKIAGAIKQMLELTPHLKDRLTPGCATTALYRLGHLGSPPCGKYHNWPVSWVAVVTVNEEYPNEDYPEQSPRLDSIESQMEQFMGLYLRASWRAATEDGCVGYAKLHPKILRGVLEKMYSNEAAELALSCAEGAKVLLSNCGSPEFLPMLELARWHMEEGGSLRRRLIREVEDPKNRELVTAVRMECSHIDSLASFDHMLEKAKTRRNNDTRQEAKKLARNPVTKAHALAEAQERAVKLAHTLSEQGRLDQNTIDAVAREKDRRWQEGHAEHIDYRRAVLTLERDEIQDIEGVAERAQKRSEVLSTLKRKVRGFDPADYA